MGQSASARAPGLTALNGSLRIFPAHHEFRDVGKSGNNTTGRPQFMEMLGRIQNGNPDGVSYILVLKLSRFGRNTADVMNSLQLMQDFGVNLICVEDAIDSSTAAGKILFPVLAAVAEMERPCPMSGYDGRSDRGAEAPRSRLGHSAGEWFTGCSPAPYTLSVPDPAYR